MAQSKTIKNQATSAKRAASTIASLVETLDWEKTRIQDKGITQAEREVLVKAVSILNKIGTTRTKLAKEKNSSELETAKAIKNAEIEANQIISSWEPAQTILDKVAISMSDSVSVERYLEDGLPIWNRAVTAQDWVDMLDELVQDAHKSLASSAAYHAVTYKKPISDVLTVHREKVKALSSHNRVKSLAKAWEAKINL